MSTKVSKGELQEEATRIGIDPDQSYEGLREEIGIRTCRECGDEFLRGWSKKFCTDGCEAAYINENF